MIDLAYGHQLIDKLIKLTCERKISWITLPRYFESNDNEPLRKRIIANNRYAYSPIEAKKVFLINEYKSYCTVINGGIISLFYMSRGKDTALDISLQIDATQNLQSIEHDDKLEESLQKLLFKISVETNDGLKFIESILAL